MLTPTDIHYVAGLLTLCSSPAEVEVELGSMVEDQAAQIKRDVDVTIRAKNSQGADVIVMGREVKAHHRPLDSTHVEQLAAKLNDMPALATRGIVSASGYTRPAIRKAAHHGIVLYNLARLDDTGNAFEHFRARNIPLVRCGPEWASVDSFHLNPQLPASAAMTAAIHANPKILIAGRPDPASPDLTSYLTLVRRKLLDELIPHWPVNEQIAGHSKRVQLTLRFNPPRAAVPSAGGSFEIEEVVARGTVRWREEHSHVPMMVLQQVGAERPEAGCAVFDSAGFGLCGLIVSNTNREIRFALIPVTDRNKKKIYRQVLQHTPTAAPVAPFA